VGELFSRWHEIAVIAVTVPILGTLVLLTWGLQKGRGLPHLIPRRRRVLVPHEASSAAPPGEESEPPPDKALLDKGRALARHLNIFGVIAFRVQLCLGLIAALVLVVTTSSSYYEEHLPSLPYGFSGPKV
jgi:hypothetical protein